MKRKLQQIGKHSLMATIPKKWIKRHQLRKGDEIEFTEANNHLIITSSQEVYKQKTTIPLLSATMEVVWRVILPAYTLGYEEITLTYEDPRTLETIENCTQNLIGLEITDTGDGWCTVKTITKALDTEFETVLRRAWHVLTQMSTALKEILTSGQKERLPEIRSLELASNRYTRFLMRASNRNGYKYPHHTYCSVTFLELTANHIEYIRRSLSTTDLQPETKHADAYTQIDGLIKRVAELQYDYSPEKFLQIAKEQPHFKWFSELPAGELKHHFTTMAEYLVQIARNMQALNT